VTQEREFLARLAIGDAVLVTVQGHRGSVPREAGAWMAVFADVALGTIGGGHLEWQAMAEARSRLQDTTGATVMRYALGPSLGQCCGGEVHLRYDRVSVANLPELRQRFDAEKNLRPQVALFGGGHVGAALVRILGSLPLQVRWIDSRDEIFPAQVPENVACEHSDPVQAAVNTLAAGTHVLIMSFSHAEDLDVVAACLSRQLAQADLGLVGLIGSQSKWATFRHRLEARGFGAQALSQVTCPIGLPGITGKAPEVIAVAIAAQLLLELSQAG
jgi:xanthine dehydrogenase accessory factor